HPCDGDDLPSGGRERRNVCRGLGSDHLWRYPVLPWLVPVGVGGLRAMSVVVTCEDMNCAKQFQVGNNLAGKQVVFPRCSHFQRIAGDDRASGRLSENSSTASHRLSPLGFAVALAIILPLMLMSGWPHPWYQTFAIAILGFGAGHLVSSLTREQKSHR